MSTTSRFVAALTAVGALALPATVVSAANGSVADYFDDFDSTTLEGGWSVFDGYANDFPNDTANHASFDLADDHLTISIPSGTEHNMWDLRHAAVGRPYDGSGVYQIKVDSDFSESQQFGLIFESSPGTFLLFMLYAHEEIHTYVERFVEVGNNLIAKKTTHGLPTGLNPPHDGPYFIRVTVNDDPVPTARSWTFDWSLDGANWNTAVEGILEESDSSANIGTINTVSLFAGNQPYEFSGFEARFDYFAATSDFLPPPLMAPVLSLEDSPTEVALNWNEVLPGDDYNVYRSTSPDGPASLIATVTDPWYVDTNVVPETVYYYSATVVRDGLESAASPPVVGSPHLNGLENIPSNGLALALLASELDLQLDDGDQITDWIDEIDSEQSATASGSARPTFVSSGIGGVPSVRFDGVDDHLSLGSGFEDFTAGLSMYVVASPSALQPGFKMVTLGNGAGQQNIGLGRANTTPGVQYFTTAASGAWGWYNTAAGLAAGDPAVYSVVQPGGAANSSVTATTSRNGAALGSGTVYVPPVTTRSVNYIGKSYWSEGWFQGDIAEILIYDRELTPAEQATVTDYLLTKYSVDPPPPPPPASPVGVSVTSGDSTVSLSWSVVAGATGYRVYRADQAAGPYSLIGDLTSTTLVDSSALNGATYQYTVSSYGPGGESAPSTSVTGSPQAPPPPPPTGIPLDGLTLALDASNLQLADGAAVPQWLNSTGTQSATASGSARPTFVSSGIGGVPSVRFDGVDDHLSLGSGFEDFTAGLSMYVVASPSALQPGFKMVTLGNGAGQQNIGLGRANTTPGVQYFTTAASGAWGWYNTAAGLAAGDPAVYSVVQPGGAANSSVTATTSRNGAALGSGTVYVPPVTTRSVNYIGKSYWSEGWFQGDIAEILIYDRELTPAEQATVTDYLLTKYSVDPPPPPPPASPVGVSVTSGDSTVSLSWSVVAGATGYRVYRADQAAGPYSLIGDLTSTTLVDSSALNGATYQYTVSSYGPGGESAPSTSVTGSPQAPPPPPPTGIPLDGLTLALDASNLQLADGAAVPQWLNSTGTQSATASGSARPTFVSSGIGGVPSVRFDGVDDHLSLGSGFEDFTAGLSMYVVASPSALQPGFKMVTLGNGAGQQNIGLGRANTTPGVQYFTTAASGAWGWYNTAAGLAAGDPAVYSVVQPGGAANSSVTATTSRNGAALGSGTVYVPPVTTRSVNYIGKSYWSEGWFQGDIAEILIYDRELTPAEQATVTDYLLTKYSVAA